MCAVSREEYTKYGTISSRATLRSPISFHKRRTMQLPFSLFQKYQFLHDPIFTIFQDREIYTAAVSRCIP